MLYAQGERRYPVTTLGGSYDGFQAILVGPLYPVRRTISQCPAPALERGLTPKANDHIRQLGSYPGIDKAGC